MQRISSFIVLSLFLSSLLCAPAYGSASYEPAFICEDCHIEVYDRWTGSRHAASFNNPLFRNSLDKVLETAPGYGRKCFFCHGPTATVPEGSMRAGRTVKEGVTCDFCHTVYAARLSDEFPRYLNSPGTKRGPVEGAVSTHHEAEFSHLSQDSKLCAGCHEFKNQHNVGILTTGSEWKESSYSDDGVHCQNCHLPQPYRKVRLLRKKMAFDKPSDHRMNGGHVTYLLRDALEMGGNLIATDDRACIELELVNDRGGHKLPTGIPTHRIVLLARLFDERGFKIGERELFFERVLGDETGTPLASPEDMFLRATSVLSDNRLAPKEKRKLSLAFPLEEKRDRMFATVSLSYELPSKTWIPETERIVFSNMIIPYHIWQVPWGSLFILLMIFIAGLLIYCTFKGEKT
jgi:hypothetical protein